MSTACAPVPAAAPWFDGDRHGLAAAADRVTASLLRHQTQVAITAITAQNTVAVTRVEAVSPAMIVAQLEKPVSNKGDYNVYLGRPAPGVVVPNGLSGSPFQQPPPG